MTLADAYKTLQSGSLWSSTGRCKGYAVANPGEAAKIDAYVAALARGERPLPPALQTATGRGVVGMLAEIVGGVTPEPPPPPGPVSPLGAKLEGFLPRKPRPTIVKPVAAGANLDTLLKNTPSTGNVVYQLQGGGWPSQAIGLHSFSAPVWIEPQPGQRVTITGAVHGLYIGNTCKNIVFADLRTANCGNTGVKLDTGDADLEFIRHRTEANVNQGFLTAQTVTRLALWDCYGKNNGVGAVGGNQRHNFYIGDCDTLLVANMLSIAAPGGSCLQLGGSVRRWCVTCSTFDGSTSPNGPGIDIYTMSTQSPMNSDGLIVNSLLTNNGYYGMLASGADPDAATQVVRKTLGYANGNGDFYPGQQFVLGDGILHADPLYMDRAGGDFRLRPGSPAIGAGDPDWTPPHDRDGVARLSADLGALAVAA